MHPEVRRRRHEAPRDAYPADVANLTLGALAEMRALIFELRPGALAEVGLAVALRKHASNVVRHAHATRGVVDLWQSEESVRLRVSDDGSGFDPARERPGHHGLRTMAERAERAGGRPARVRQLHQRLERRGPRPGGSAAMPIDGGPIRVFLVDDHAVVRRGLEAYLTEIDDLQIVGEAGGGREAIGQIGALAREGCAPDVVLMDLVMEPMDGVETTRQLRARHPGVEVVALTSFAEEERVHAAGAS